MADGTTKPMSEIKVGDHVLAADPETGEKGSRPVTAVWIHQDTVLDLVVEGGAAVTTTEDHPYWNATENAWQRADQLNPGDALMTASGRHVRVKGLQSDTRHAASAYNLTVHDIHTYFVRIVGNAIDVNALVHNAGPGCFVEGDMPRKVVNSNMGHINGERAARAGFADVQSARAAVQDLGNSIQQRGFPSGSIPDTVRADRTLVPIGTRGYAVYQRMPNGNAVFKTILERR